MTLKSDMNEDTTRGIVRESLLHTSDKFTQELMLKVKRKNALRNEFSTAFLIGCSCCVFILFLVVVSPSQITFFHLQVPSFYTKLLGIISTFSLLNKLIAMKKALAAN